MIFETETLSSIQTIQPAQAVTYLIVFSIIC